MHEVYFVDDEAAVRRAIIGTLDWESAGFTICGQADNGEQALPEILARRPELLITDIKMPFMDGLELSRLVKKELPDTVILILSGYDEFDFTREAIRVGVFDYILKPVTTVKLMQALGRAAERIEHQTDERRKKSLLQPAFTAPEDLQQLDFSRIEHLVNRPEISEFVKNASTDQIDGFLLRQMRTVREAAQVSKLARLCCVYDIVTTASSAAATMGIVTPPLRNFLPAAEEQSPADEEEPLRRLFSRILAARDEMADSKSQLVHRAKLCIEQRHSDPDLSLGAVAAQIGVAPNYLSALFSREAGETFSEYLNKVRIRHTIELLNSSPDSLAEIARKVGYNDQYYLSKTFKKTLGVSPREYKKM